RKLGGNVHFSGHTTLCRTINNIKHAASGNYRNRYLPYSSVDIYCTLSDAVSSLSMVVMVVIVCTLLHVTLAGIRLALLLIAALVVVPRPLLLVHTAALTLPLSHALIVDRLSGPCHSGAGLGGGRR
ncbi:hypothetical protein PFISCL1PPCAC_5077, partial [Pristionchus fissidentatus]